MECYTLPNMMNWPKTATFILFIAIVTACKKPAPLSGSPSEITQAAWFKKLPPERQAAWLAEQKQQPAREAKAAQDRAELVRPAPSDFKPENDDRRIRLRLIAQKEMMRAGEHFWYRLELQNVGRKPIHWYEKSSFFKHGRLNYSKQGIKFFVRQPDGKEWGLVPPISLPLLGENRKGFSFPPGTTEAEQARRFKRMVGMANINELSIILLPGETLVTRAWAERGADEANAIFARGEDPDAAIPGEFRELTAFFRFDQRGAYRVRVVYDDRPSPLTEENIRSSEKYGISRKDEVENQKFAEENALGPVQSNIVSVEVTP